MITAIIPEDMDEICRQTWPIFQEDQPVLFLLPDLWLSAAHKKVKGLQNRTALWSGASMPDLWIEEGEPASGGPPGGGGS